MFFFISVFFFCLSLVFFYFGLFFLLGEFSFLVDWELFSFNSVEFVVTFFFDWISMSFSGLVLLISSMVILYSYDYMSSDDNKIRFLLILFLFVVSMLIMIFSLNMVGILLGWDGLGFTSYCLVSYYQNYSSYVSAMLTLLTNRIGDVFILLSICWLVNYGSFNFMFYMNFIDYYKNYIVFFILIAAFTKSAQVPFSSWLPAAMAAPTPVSSLVHSSTLVTAGVYLLIRFNYLLSGFFMISFFFFLSFFTMFMSSICAVYEFDLSKIIALSTLSQLGLMMGILFLGYSGLSFFHLLSHAFFKSLLFLCSGLIIHGSIDGQDIRCMGGLVEDSPYVMSCFFISNVSLCGLFFLSGFYSKDTMLESIFWEGGFNYLMIFIYLFSLTLTVWYTFRLLNYLILSGLFFYSSRSVDDGIFSKISLILLVFFSIIFGFFFNYCCKVYNFMYTYFLKILYFLLVEFVGITFDYIEVLIFKGSFFEFFNSMWFLFNLSTKGISFMFNMISLSFQELVDESWGEYYFSSYFSSSLMYFSYIFNYLIFNNLKLYLCFILISMIILLI
uniref:NADH-ubiquinone oxidoreductase chain 5 n=1 Tax=Phatnoma laciniatum TaxID=1964415 RepID=A0A343BT98_9HEMI|nr:NADH dehydrogenase subunit 5 [Phatnoma laciniatum]ARB50163.1 NADH dehydrogenase subunit 5 [Phatnoma laciniatum]